MRARSIARQAMGMLTLLCVLASALGLSTLRALAQGEIATKAHQAVLMDAESGGILFQRNGNDMMYPASMSKLMLLAVVFKAMRKGEVKEDQLFLMTESATRRGGAAAGASAMQVPPGTRLPLDELIKGIVVQSGNDAAICIAENMSGTEANFAKRMTEEARAIGLRKSVFRNATGLFQAEHQMTAKELAVLARHLIRTYPEHYALFAMRDYTWRKTRFVNRNPLLGLVPGADGLKTGHLKEAGYGLVGSALQDGRRLIVVVNGLATMEERRDEARKLLEWGFRSFTEARLFEADDEIGRLRVWGADRLTVPVKGPGEITLLVPRAAGGQRFTGRIYYTGPLKPPLKRGDQIAVLRVTSAQDASLEVPLHVAEDVGPGPLWWRGLDSLLHLATRWVP
ncbi:MAG: D-alanyl-D-alanine carboxypeptidase family protein [Hyphomicrobiaceae bacterium]|nr:D-alanyl-D-alanine carboxypeptidase family protein [Hyphomicrobiaceae bacterium]